MATIVTPDFVLETGLQAVGFDDNRRAKVNRSTNLSRFRSHFGSNPIVYAEIWEDFKRISIAGEADDVDDQNRDITMFLMAIKFLRCYPTEAELAATFQVCERTARKWCMYYAKKIQALKSYKVKNE